MKARVGIIGGGIWGKYHLQAAKQLEAEGLVHLAAIAARTQKTADERAAEFGIRPYTDYRQMIEQEDLQAVCVVTPDHLHREMSLYAIERGLHVMVEKPMDMTTAGCLDMVRAAEAAGVLLQVDFHKRYDPYNIDMMRQVQSGKIGEPYYAYAYMEDKLIVPSEWLAGWAASSSPFWFIGVHKYDLVRWITGREAVQVFAHGYKGKLQDMGIDTYDAVSASILMQDGMTCTIHANWIVPNGFEAFVNQGLRLIGREGLVEIDSQDRGLRFASTSNGMATPNLGAIFAEDSVFGWRAVKGYFVDAIKDFLLNVVFLGSGGKLEQLAGRYPSGWDGLRVTQVAEAVDTSMATGGPVEVEQVPTAA